MNLAPLSIGPVRSNRLVRILRRDLFVVAALLTLLTEVPLAGRTISMDAGLLTGTVTQTITRQEGDYIGMVKGNNPEVLAVLDAWVATAVLSPLGGNGSAPADPRSPDCIPATEADRSRCAT